MSQAHDSLAIQKNKTNKCYMISNVHNYDSKVLELEYLAYCRLSVSVANPPLPN